MSRSGYSASGDESFPNATELYHANVLRAISGKRGQAFLRDLLKALDDMPVKRLIAGELLQEGEVCAIGALGRARGIDMSALRPDEYWSVAEAFKIAEPLAREIVFENDDAEYYRFSSTEETPEARWQRMRAWAEAQMKSLTPEPPRFVIINDTDRPEPDMVCQYVPRKGYCYLRRSGIKPNFDGMKGRDATPIEAFGFVWQEQKDGWIRFTRISTSTATYRDGEPRSWQSHDTAFSFPKLTAKGIREQKKEAKAAPGQ